MAYSKARGKATRGKSYKKPKIPKTQRTKVGWPDVKQKGPWKPGGPFPGAALGSGISGSWSSGKKGKFHGSKKWKTNRKFHGSKKWPRSRRRTWLKPTSKKDGGFAAVKAEPPKKKKRVKPPRYSR